MKTLVPFVLASLTLMGQDTETARALISSDFIGAVDSLGTRAAQTNLTVVYLDTAKDEQFIDVTAIRADVTQFIRATTATATPEAFAKAVGKGLAEKYTQIAGLIVTIYTSFNNQGTPQYKTTLTRLAPSLTPATKAAVTQRLVEAQSAQSRIVR